MLKFFNRKQLCIIAVLFFCVVSIGFLIIRPENGLAQTACKNVGQSCFTGADCCSKVCNNATSQSGGACVSCDNYCKSNGYTSGTCEIYNPNYGYPGPSYKAQCSFESGQCTSYPKLSAPLFAAPDSGDILCPNDPRICEAVATIGPDGNPTNPITTTCYDPFCFCYTQKQETCSPYCSSRCTNSGGCQPLASGFKGCQQGGGTYGSLVCDWYLAKGFNLISFPVLSSITDLQDALKNIAGKYISIQTYNNGIWENINPIGAWLSTFTTGGNLKPENGYLINMSEPAIFSIKGKTTATSEDSNYTTIQNWLNGIMNSLQTGKNIVGFPFRLGSFPLNTTYFYENKNKLSEVYWLNWGSPSIQDSNWAFYSAAGRVPEGSGASSLNYLEPGKAYIFFKPAYLCSECGQGLFNICDEKECLGLGACYFEPGGIAGILGGGKCLPKCSYDAQCTNKCPSGQFAACDKLTSQCGCQTVCTETDKGKDYETFGITGGQGDVCSTKNTNLLQEFFCQDNRVQSETYICPYGCKNGYCKKACIDTDGGQKFNAFGTATYDDKIVEDKCEADGKTLTEAYCAAGDAAISTTKYTCPFGCSNGVCFRDAEKTALVEIKAVQASGSIGYPVSGAMVYIRQKDYSSPINQCLTSKEAGSCIVYLPAGEYEAYISNDPFYQCWAENGCPASFSVQEGSDLTVSLPLLKADLSLLKKSYCQAVGDAGDIFQKSAVKYYDYPTKQTYVCVDECAGTNPYGKVQECTCGTSMYQKTLNNCANGCFDGACIKGCTETFGPGYTCVQEGSLPAGCTDRIEKLMPNGAVCNSNMGNTCVFCKQSCTTEQSCANFKCCGNQLCFDAFANSTFTFLPMCGTDSKCFCQEAKKCNTDIDCINTQCQTGQKPICQTSTFAGKACYCLNDVIQKKILVHADDKYTTEDLRGILVTIVDRKKNNATVASCVTDENRDAGLEPRGKCTISPLTFSSEHEYVAVVQGAVGYKNAEIPLINLNNYDYISANFHLLQDDASIVTCNANSKCALFPCPANYNPTCDMGRCICQTGDTSLPSTPSVASYIDNTKDQTISLMTSVGAVKMIIPKGTFQINVTADITAVKVSSADVSGKIATLSTSKTIIGDQVFDFSIKDAQGNEIHEFDKPITIQVPYVESQLNGALESFLRLFIYNEQTEQWKLLATTVDTKNNILTATTNHFSAVVVGIDPVSFNLSTHTSLEDLLNSITKWLLYFALVLAPLMIILGGFYILTSRGDPKMSTTGKSIIKWALIGLVVILSAKAFISIITSVLK
ncbi:MAG: pilin [Candidatus Pacebacteria bacterium]|nr:pilin [Candidatus Paceibacterota bacterium]